MVATGRPVIDSDVHCATSIRELYPYLSSHWPEYLDATNFKQPYSVNLTYPEHIGMVATPSHRSSLDGLRREVLDRANAAILRCYFGVESMQHPYLGPELASAINRWLRDQWLNQDERLLASAVITPQFASAAVDEIARIAEDPRFVEILLPARSAEGYGNQRYWPIWKAAAEKHLVLEITFGGAAGIPPTPVNWMSSFFEQSATAVLNFQTQMISLIMCGVFDQWPSLRVVISESGWTWLPGFMWRMDAEWKQYKREIPWLTAPPSSYVRRHFRFTVQPTDAPRSPDQLRQVLDQLGDDEFDAAQMLLYASDYPHSYSGGIDKLLAVLPPDGTDRVMWSNAWEWYGQSGRSLPSLRSSGQQKSGESKSAYPLSA